MSRQRDDFITAYRQMYGCSETEADRTLRDVELAYATQQNTELQQALDEADGQHTVQTADYRQQIDVLQRMLETIPNKHMKFGLRLKDGTIEEPDQCADWCYACRTEKLQADIDEWKTYEARARGFAMQFAALHEYTGPALAHIQAGDYAKALPIIEREMDRGQRTHRAVVSIIAVEEGGKLDCCDEETHHVWVTVLTWSGRRAYLTGASPFLKAVGETVIENVTDLTGTHFYADLPFNAPPAVPEPGEHLEWPGLELTPPTEEIERRLGLL